ncbi:MAG: hypothetical protein HOY78_45910 [Saccharothrix sp.]|nr:hypothetical protein [Saccharothrix sp.]
MTTRRTIIPLAALSLVLPLLIAGRAAGVPAELPVPTNTSDVVVTRDAPTSKLPVVRGIRLGRHHHYDRLVFDIAGSVPSYSARYVAAAYSEGGARVPVRGAAVLVVSLHPVDTARPPAVPVHPNLSTIRDVVGFDQHGGYLNHAIGVSDRNGFRVFELANPTRLVIDIAPDLPAPTSTELRASPLGDDRNAHLTAIRTGAHPRYDRVVFDFTGPNTGLRHVVGYRDGALRVDLGHGTTRDATGTPTYTGPWTLHPGLEQVATIRIVNAADDLTTILITVRHTAGFRVLSLHSPERIAVDIAH